MNLNEREERNGMPLRSSHHCPKEEMAIRILVKGQKGGGCSAMNKGANNDNKQELEDGASFFCV